MATELRILAWCDVCLEAGKETPGQTVTVDVTGGPAFDVEACPEHGGPLAAAVAALRPYGRGVGKGVPKVPSKAASKATPTPTPDAPAQEWANREKGAAPGPCPVCGKEAVSYAAMRQHLKQAHEKSLADVGFAAANETCPECGSKFPNQQGLAAHFRLAHPGITRAKQSA